MSLENEFEQDSIFDDIQGTDPETELVPEQDVDPDEDTTSVDTETDTDSLHTDSEKETEKKEPAKDPEGSDPDKKDPNKKDEDAKPDSDISNMSGIERYLSNYDIEGGMIKFDDGSQAHFNDLDAETQETVLNTLHNSVAKSIEEKYGLNEDEIGLINYLRENKATVDDLVEARVNERLSATSDKPDFKAMTEEEVYRRYMQESDKELNKEDIEKDLEEAKKLSTFKGLVKGMRTQLENAQSAKEAELAKTQAKLDQERIEEDRRLIMDVVIPMKSLAGVELNDNLKNTVLDKVLEVTSEGESIFQNEILSDPEKLFKAAFLYYQAESILEQKENYWKKEKSAAYLRGKTDALGKDRDPISFTKKPKADAQKETSASQRTETYDELDDLHSI